MIKVLRNLSTQKGYFSAFRGVEKTPDFERASGVSGSLVMCARLWPKYNFAHYYGVVLTGFDELCVQNGHIQLLVYLAEHAFSYTPESRKVMFCF